MLYIYSVSGNYRRGCIMENEQNVVTEAAQANVDNAVQAVQNAAVTQTGKKKGGKAGNIFGWLLFIAIGVGVAVWLLFFNYQPTFSVDGKEFKMKKGVSGIYDAGLVLAYSDGSIVDETFKILPNTLYNVTYDVCKASNGKVTAKTGLKVKVFNSASSSKKITDCSIYSIFFYPADAPAGTTVLLNGQDFSSVTRATAKDLCKAAKMQFKANDLDKFANGDKNIVSASSSAFRWDIQEDHGTIYFTFTKNNVKINYK